MSKNLLCIVFIILFVVTPPNKNENLARARRGELAQVIGSTLLLRGQLFGFYPASSRAQQRLTIGRLRNLTKRAERDSSTLDKFFTFGVLLLVRRQPWAALKYFEMAAALPEAGAEAHSDLAAVYLHLAQEENHPEYLIEALVQAHKAIVIAPSLPEANFNISLVLEALGLRYEAASAWRRYLTLEHESPESPWYAEAQKRLEYLADTESYEGKWDRQRTYLTSAGIKELNLICASFPQELRLYVEEELIPAWARLTASGEFLEAKEKLDLASMISNTLAVRTGDHLLLDSVSAIKFASVKQLSSIVEGHVLYAQALSTYKRQDFPLALALFEVATKKLKAGDTPFYRWASFYANVCLYQTFQYQQAMHGLWKMAVEKSTYSDSNLQGRVLWMIGLLHVIKGDLLKSLAYYKMASAQFEKTGEIANIGSVNRLIAQNLRYLGYTVDAWKFRLQALQSLSRSADLPRLQSVLQESVLACHKQARLEAALYFQRETLWVAEELNSPLYLVSALRRQANLLQQMGMVRQALLVVREAQLQAAKINDPSLRYSSFSDLLAIESEAQIDENPVVARSMLTRALGRYDMLEYGIYAWRLYLLRARANEAVGDIRGAKADFEAAAHLVQGFRQKTEPSSENSYPLLERDVYDQAVLFFVRQKDYGMAFCYAEMGRVQRLQLGLSRREVNGCNRDYGGSLLHNVQAHLANEEAAIDFLVLGDRVLTWVITSKTVNLSVTKLDVGRLQGAVQSLCQKLRKGNGSKVEQLAQLLYCALIRQSDIYLKHKYRLIVIPDRCLFGLPFAALIDPRSGQFLVQRFAIGMLPAVTLLQRNRGMRLADNDNILVVGISNFHGTLNLRDLPYAKKEADEVAGIYKGSSTLLIDHDASKSRFEESLHGQAMLHLATHSLTGAGTSGTILLGKQQGADVNDSIDSKQLVRLGLRNSRLVFLASCRTGGSIGVENAGSTSLSYLLVESGVSSVVASLWEVNDQDSVDLVVAFYQGIHSGLDILTALQRAQILLLERRKSVGSTWTAFYVTGYES